MRLKDLLPKFSLYVQPTLLRENQHIAVIITERFALHRFVGQVDMDGKAFSQSGIAIASQGPQARDEVRLLVVWGQTEGVPRKLGWANVDFRVQGEEAGLKLRAVRLTRAPRS